MKPLISVAIFAFTFLMINAPSAHAQTTQNYQGSAILPSTYESLVCLGSWDAASRKCDGPQVSAGGLSAISAMKSADKLEQIRVLLDSMNNKLSANTEAVLAIRKSFDHKKQQANESLHDAIVKRFDALPAEILTDDAVKQELERLKDDILKEVDKRNPKPRSSSGK